MRTFCHRCNGDLPLQEAGSGSARGAPALFCPHCGAPQLRLAESARSSSTPTLAAPSTGSPPPPHPGQVNWPVALQSALPVVAVAAVLKLVAFMSVAVAILSDGWVALASLFALGLYARRLPAARLSSRAGLRIGLMTGVLLIAAVGCAMAAAGVTLRFGLHRAAVVDTAVASAVATAHQALATAAAQQSTPANEQAVLFSWLDSPEVQAGATLAYLGYRALLVLLFTASAGALAGSMGHRRAMVPRPR